jgi:lipopolysaccharide transport system permease protein
LKTIIDSSSTNFLDIKEILRFKDLLWNLSKRDILIRYKQTFVGILWAVIRPCINITIFGLISQFIEHTDNMSERLITVSAGVIIWGLISTSIIDSSNSILGNSNILTKVYFPKIIIPMSSLMVCLVDFLISFVILMILRCTFMGMPGPELFLFPLFVIYSLVFSFSIGLLFATMNVRYRDIKFILPFLIQIGFYVCPVFLTTNFYLTKLPEVLKPVFLANPLVFIIEGFKYCILGQPIQVPMMYIGIGFLITIFFLFISLRYFTRFERTFADHI